MIIKHKGIEYEIELDNVQYDHDYWCDTYISSAFDVTNNRELSDEEIGDLQDDLSDNIIHIISEYLH